MEKIIRCNAQCFTGISVVTNTGNILYYYYNILPYMIIPTVHYSTVD
jgi:hypothetical protein